MGFGILTSISPSLSTTNNPGLKLPEELQGYHTLVPLEPSGTGAERRKFGNWYSTVYRAIRSSDGLPYALRRIESVCFQFLSLELSSPILDFRLTRQSAFAPIEVWSSLRHPGIVSVREAFTTRSFDDNCMPRSVSHKPYLIIMHQLSLSCTHTTLTAKRCSTHI